VGPRWFGPIVGGYSESFAREMGSGDMAIGVGTLVVILLIVLIVYFLRRA
jgi:hypothetical protein